MCTNRFLILSRHAFHFVSSVATLIFCATAAYAQTGKIAGRVVEAQTGHPIPGVNILIEDTHQGTITEADGYYTLLNVRPGIYRVRASSVGFTRETVAEVRVNIDLTTAVDFRLQESTLGLDEVVVEADRPIVQRDVSASVANLDFDDVESLPLTDLAGVVGLQPGFERGLTIRGSGEFDRVSVLVDGMDFTSGRDNLPFTGISYTSIDEVQVQTGGFNAEYGEVRAGLINVVTREGHRDRYSADILFRYGPPHQKHFPGIDLDGNEVPLPNSPDSPWVRPYFDPDVAYAGTRNGTWDIYMIDAYNDFSGWDLLAQSFPQNMDADPNNDVTAGQMMEAFRWYLRKDIEIRRPDYVIDGTIGGPVPGISRRLGDLRFTTSLRRTATQYLLPQIREDYSDALWQGKLTSNLAPGIELDVVGLWSRQWGVNSTSHGWPYMWTGQMPTDPWHGSPEIMATRPGDAHIFRTHAFNPMEVTRAMVGLQLTHALSARTFYKAQVEYMNTDYFTHTGTEKDLRDYSIQHIVPPPADCPTCGSIELDGAPFGWEWQFMTDKLGAGLITGKGFTARDSSRVGRWSARFDLTSQLNRFTQLKTGLQYIHADHDTNYGMVDPASPYNNNQRYVWHQRPVQGALYSQAKFEFLGMIANLGVRLDYVRPGDEWYVYKPFDRAFASVIGKDRLDETLGKEPIDAQIALSPRLGVSFPITKNSKFFFNYGHFRQVLRPLGLFVIEEFGTGAVTALGNPNHPMPLSVAYEVGFEQSLFDRFHVRIAGYYRDQSLQERFVRYESIDGETNYLRTHPFNYADHRGIEFTFSKNQGDWIRGFINYTYHAGSSGNFGTSIVYENPTAWREYLRTSTDHYQVKPVPQPFASMNLEVFTPPRFGPEAAGLYPLGGWRADLLGRWHSGKRFTWTGLNLTNLAEVGNSTQQLARTNVRWRDYWNFDLRLSKQFTLSNTRMLLFLDVTNVFTLRHLYLYSFRGDQMNYMRSLHLPERTFEHLEHEPYRFIYGNDRPGDYRKAGVRFTPIEIVTSLPASNNERPLYYLWGEKSYYWYRNGQYGPADPSFVKEVLDTKAYIDMPYATPFTFLNPRAFYLGIRIDF